MGTSWRGHNTAPSERVGFEPTVPLRIQLLSREPDSTTLAPLPAVRTPRIKGIGGPSTRRGRDSNPRSQKTQRFSRPPPSTTRTPLRGVCALPEVATIVRRRRVVNLQGANAAILGERRVATRSEAVWRWRPGPGSDEWAGGRTRRPSHHRRPGVEPCREQLATPQGAQRLPRGRSPGAVV